MSASQPQAASTQTPWRRPELHIDEPGRPRRCVALERGEPWLVGRSSACQIVLHDRRVSRRHLRLVVSATGLTAVDLGSRAGTWRNGQRLPAEVPVELRDGDELRLGRTRIRIAWYAQRLARFVELADLPERTELPASAPPDAAAGPPAPELREEMAEPTASRTRSDPPRAKQDSPQPAAVARPAGVPTGQSTWAWPLAAAALLLAAGVLVLVAR